MEHHGAIMHALTRGRIRLLMTAWVALCSLGCSDTVSEEKEQPTVRDVVPPNWTGDLFRVVERGPRHATLEWSDATDDIAVAYYELELADISRAHKVRGTSFLLSALPAGATLSATVVAVDRAGNRSLAPMRLSFETMPECQVQRPALPARVAQ